MKTPMKSAIFRHYTAFFVGVALWMLPALGPWCSAATLTVGPFGDKNYTRIGDAVKAAAVNDIIEVYPGQYDEPTIVLDKTVTVRGKYDPIQQRIIGAGDGFSATTGYPVLEALTITRSGHGVVLTGTANCTVRNCLLLANGGNGVNIGAEADWRSSALFVLNCVLGYNTASGFGIRGSTTMSVANSIFVGNAGYGIEQNNGWAWLKGSIDYCVFFGNSRGTTTLSPDVGLGTHIETSSDPKFRDIDKQDFRLKSDSVAVNTGDPSPASQDPDGTRNDIGVYGGPYSRRFWYGPGPGPTVRDLVAIPPVVKYGRTFRVEGKAQVEPAP